MSRCVRARWLVMAWIAAVVGAAPPAGAGVYHMAPDGDDDGDGSASAPFTTFTRAFAVLDDGDILLLAGGVYREPIRVDGVTAGITIRGKAGERAVLKGTRPLPRNWVEGEDGVWSQQVDFDLWQLFNGDRLVYLARWPNASFEDHSLWRMTSCMRSADGGYEHKRSAFFGRCREGVIYDAPFVSGGGKGFHEGDSRYPVVEGQESLAESGKAFTGAAAMLNIGHWLSWARPITRHRAGADHFEYDPLGELPLKRYFAWYILGLEALDRPNEWWFDHATRTLYYQPPPGINPNALPLEGRVRDLAMELTSCANLRFENLECFAGSFWLRDCRRVRFEDCRFLYAATHKIPLGEFGWFHHLNLPTSPARMPAVSGGGGNLFLNCEFGYCNAPIYFGGDGDRVENCSFHDIEWDLLSSGASGSVMVGHDAVFIRNTLARTGNSEGIRPIGEGARIELNHCYDMGNLQHDGAAIDVGTTHHVGTVVTRNWAHDCNRQGMRFDYSGTRRLRPDGRIHGDGVYFRNVSWKTQPNQVKGDRHLILNNTVISVNRYPDPATEAFNMSVQGFKCMHDIDGNAHSVTRNNLANLTHRGWNLDTPSRDGWNEGPDGTRVPGAYRIPGTADHNMREKGAAYRYLRDPENHDFRPQPDSPLVDGGAVLNPEEIRSEVITFPGIRFRGKAPDIGAYEYGDERYWIPGRRGSAASMPVPRDGARDVPLDADLMFLEAYRSTRHVVYFGVARDELKRIRTLNDLHSNIVKPPLLESGRTYYWRVDAIMQDGEAAPSPVWRFVTR